jgi:hypothetical protein
MMRIFFWDFDDYNDIGRYIFVDCREWAMFILNLFVFLFTSVALFKTARFHRKCVF